MRKPTGVMICSAIFAYYCIILPIVENIVFTNQKVYNGNHISGGVK